MGRKPKKKSFKLDVGTIFQKEDGGNFYYRYQVNGKRHAVSLKTSDEKSAKIEAEKYIPIIEAPSTDVIVAQVQYAKRLGKDRQRLLLRKAWDEYDAHPDKASPKTKNIYLYYKAYFRDFIEWAKGRKLQYLDEVTDAEVVKYVAYLKKQKIGVDTHNKRISRVGHVFKVLNDYTTNETSDWKNPNFKRKKSEETGIAARRLPFDNEQEETVLTVLSDPARKFHNKEELRILFLLGAYTGQRMKDCCLLQWDTVDLKRRRIRVTQFKTGKTVSIPMAQQLVEPIEKAKEWESDTYVLPALAKRYLKKNKDGKDVGSGMVNKDVMRVIEAALGEERVKVKLEERDKSVTVYGFHSLRHSFAQMCIDNNVPKAVAVSILGADSEILDRYYTHIGDEAQEQAMQLISGVGSSLRQRHDKALEFLDGLKRKNKDIKKLEEILRG